MPLERIFMQRFLCVFCASVVTHFHCHGKVVRDMPMVYYNPAVPVGAVYDRAFLPE
jgi:hypothetical protein